jgi:hypothetical protein
VVMATEGIQTIEEEDEEEVEEVEIDGVDY